MRMRKMKNLEPRMEHGGDTYRQRSGDFQGFSFGMNPCASMCLCMRINRYCCPGAGWLLCCL